MRLTVGSAPVLAATRKAVLIIVLSLLAVATLPVAAHATPPESESLDGTYQDELFAECDGFDVLRNGTFTVVRTTFFGADGEPASLQIHVTRRATLENSVTGTTVRDDAVWTITIDLTADTAAGRGKIENITVPGHGSVRYDIGRWVESAEGVSFAGRTGDDGLCAALAGS
jgi:hypothetical protein